MTPELQQLRSQQGMLQGLFDSLELELVDDPDWSEPSDDSYLTDDERRDPDIASNIEAMRATYKLISWFGKDFEGFVGLWRGPDNSPLDCAPIARLDTEGQYRLIAQSIGDYIAISIDDEDFPQTRSGLLAAGFDVSESNEEIWSSLDSSDEPNNYRHKLYNEARVRRGLEPIDL